MPPVNVTNADSSAAAALQTLLAVTDPYRHWQPATVAALCAIGRKTYVNPGQALVYGVRDTGHVYLVESGVFEFSVTISNGQQQAFGYLHPGAFFGLPQALSLVRQQEHYEYVAALPSVVWRFTAQQFKAWMASLPEAAETMMGIACTRLGMMQDTVANFSLLSAEARVARCLLKSLRDCEFKVYWAKSPTERFDITQGQLARMLGLSRQSVGMIMREFAQRGLVDTGRQRIDIVNPAGLQAIVSGSPRHAVEA